MPKKSKILLVEDDTFTRFMMTEIIETLGVDVDIATNGHEACDRLAETPEAYGVILMDIHMPELSGVEATSKIRASPNHPPRNLPIIAVTADESYHSYSVVSELGMDGFIAKPITPGELNSVVDQYCVEQ